MLRISPGIFIKQAFTLTELPAALGASALGGYIGSDEGRHVGGTALGLASMPVGAGIVGMELATRIPKIPGELAIGLGAGIGAYLASKAYSKLMKKATSLGPGPESRLIPSEKDVLKKVVPNKRKPNIPVAPEVPGVTYSAPIPG